MKELEFSLGLEDETRQFLQNSCKMANLKNSPAKKMGLKTLITVPFPGQCLEVTSQFLRFPHQIKTNSHG